MQMPKPEPHEALCPLVALSLLVKKPGPVYLVMTGPWKVSLGTFGDWSDSKMGILLLHFLMANTLVFPLED